MAWMEVSRHVILSFLSSSLAGVMALLERAHDADKVRGATSQPLLPQTPACPSPCPWSWMGWSALRALPTVRQRPSSRQLWLPSATSSIGWRAQVQGEVTQGPEPRRGADARVWGGVSRCGDHLGIRTRPAGS